MGVKDFYGAVTPGSKPSEYSGTGKFKILQNGDERSSEVFEAQKVATSPNGGVLNQVSCGEYQFYNILLNG